MYLNRQLKVKEYNVKIGIQEEELWKSISCEIFRDKGIANLGLSVFSDGDVRDYSQFSVCSWERWREKAEEKA